MPTLQDLGWNAQRETAFAEFRKQGLLPARVAVEHKHRYVLLWEQGELSGEVTGRLLYVAASSAELPRVGDWVAVAVFDNELGIIHAVLPRSSKFSRQAAGRKTEEQVIAANIDRVFIVQSLDQNFNLRRLERYLLMIYEGGALPGVILNKADLCPDPAARVAAVEAIAPGVDVLATSPLSGLGKAELQALIRPGETCTFAGSSGVGKSTLINWLFGKELQATAEISAWHHKGKHTTTRRELFLLPGGGILIDTPGMRELQVWHADSGLEAAFNDIETLAADCRFADCTHTSETGCAVLAAREAGEIPEDRYQSYLKLQKELRYLETRDDKDSYLEKKRQDKILHRMIKKLPNKRK